MSSIRSDSADPPDAGGMLPFSVRIIRVDQSLDYRPGPITTGVCFGVSQSRVCGYEVRSVVFDREVICGGWYYSGRS